MSDTPEGVLFVEHGEPGQEPIFVNQTHRLKPVVSLIVILAGIVGVFGVVYLGIMEESVSLWASGASDNSLGMITEYSEVKKLIASDGAASDIFGHGNRGAAVFGDLVIVAAIGDDDLSGSSSTVYVFSRTHREDGRNYWTEEAKIKPADGGGRRHHRCWRSKGR